MKLYISISFILFSLSLHAQHMMLAGGTEAAPPSGDLLLDNYPGAAAAYSLRELSTAWAGLDVIRVRESGSNTEQDFTAAEITDGTLATFCGVNDGFVVNWYDQSGNANHATQLSTFRQPKIVASGVVVLENALPGLDFSTSTSTTLATANFLSNSPLSILIVAKINNASTVRAGLFNANSASAFSGSTGFRFDNYQGSLRMGSDGVFVTASNTSTTMQLRSGFATSGGGYIYIDGTLAASNAIDFRPSFTGVTSANLGYMFDGFSFDGVITEIIIYNSDQSSSRSGIESNMNTYYSIY